MYNILFSIVYVHNNIYVFVNKGLSELYLIPRLHLNTPITTTVSTAASWYVVLLYSLE